MKEYVIFWNDFKKVLEDNKHSAKEELSVALLQRLQEKTLS